MNERWRGTNTCSHTKEFVSTPQERLANNLLTLNKLELSYTIGIITGHIRLNAYLNKIGVRDDPDCDQCGRAAESATHFLCNCPGLSSLRRRIFKHNFLTPGEVMTYSIRSIINFTKQSGRFPAMAQSSPSNSLTIGHGNGGSVTLAPLPDTLDATE